MCTNSSMKWRKSKDFLSCISRSALLHKFEFSCFFQILLFCFIQRKLWKMKRENFLIRYSRFPLFLHTYPQRKTRNEWAFYIFSTKKVKLFSMFLLCMNNFVFLHKTNLPTLIQLYVVFSKISNSIFTWMQSSGRAWVQSAKLEASQSIVMCAWIVNLPSLLRNKLISLSTAVETSFDALLQPPFW